MQYDYIAWRESGLWTAHSPSLPGVYGIGKSRPQAENDLFEAVDELLDYLDEIGERAPKPVRLSQATMSVGR